MQHINSQPSINESNQSESTTSIDSSNDSDSMLLQAPYKQKAKSLLQMRSKAGLKSIDR